MNGVGITTLCTTGLPLFKWPKVMGQLAVQLLHGPRGACMAAGGTGSLVLIENATADDSFQNHCGGIEEPKKILWPHLCSWSNVHKYQRYFL